MKYFNFHLLLSLAMLLTATIAQAGSVKLSDVRQVVNSNPNRQGSSATGRLIVSRAGLQAGERDGNNHQTVTAQQQDSRVIVEDESVIIEEEPCNCPEPIFGTKPFVAAAAFPWWALGFGGAPLAFIGNGGNNTDNLPTATPPQTGVSPTPTPDTSPTPMVSPSGTPQPVPEPMTILLFGTGLAAVGIAKRRWQRNKSCNNENL